MKTLAEKLQAAIESALVETVQSGAYRTYLGPSSERLAHDLSELHAGAAVLLTSSGTAALELALRGAKVTAGSEVILSGYDYPGNFWAVERVGARPVLVDLQPASWRIDVGQVADLARQPNSIAALIVSHLHGELQPMAELMNIAEKCGWLVIEDNCQALGSKLDQGMTGTLGHVGILSFGGGKVLSAGRGGALITSDVGLMQHARLAAGAGSGPYTLSELQAAVVLAQLPWLGEIQRDTSDYFVALDEHLRLAGCDWACPPRSQLLDVAPYQVGWLLGNRGTGPLRELLIRRLQEVGVAAGGGFAGFHRRSSRRCRTPVALHQVAQRVDETLTLHHRQALDQSAPPAATANAIMQAWRELDQLHA